AQRARWVQQDPGDAEGAEDMPIGGFHVGGRFITIIMVITTITMVTTIIITTTTMDIGIYGRPRGRGRNQAPGRPRLFPTVLSPRAGFSRNLKRATWLAPANTLPLAKGRRVLMADGMA
ncbi:MAG TPA: hypothetical protein PK156_17025, partial [Polyangium sp.]|nr:hypothetical protein [Polyangium sp.]